MIKDRNSYISILKATSLFGGAKFFQILISIIRSKFIAVLLGPSGMGISGLIYSSIDIISSLTGLGLQTSSVREVSKSFSEKSEFNKNLIITVLRRIIFLTGLLGTLITFLFSTNLSFWAFGNDQYSLAFKLVSVVLMFNQINIGQTVLLQGTFRYKNLAMSNLTGSIFSLLLTIPLYYFWGLNGIVPAIIISALIQLLSSWFYSRKVPYQKINLTVKQIFIKSKKMISLGLAIAIAGFAVKGKDYLLRILISNFGSMNDVGFFLAGITIASNYVGMVLTAMSTDYSPRLAVTANNNKEFIEIINKQSILLVILLSPLISFFIVFKEQVILILYSDKFLAISGMLGWLLLGMLFRAVSWAISFSFIGRGNSKLFLVNELISKIYSLSFSTFLYLFFGLTGLGIAFFLTYVFYTIHMYFLAKIKFKFSFRKEFFEILTKQSVLLFIGFMLITILDNKIIQFLGGILICLIITWISIKKLNKIIDIDVLLNKIKIKILKKSFK